MTERIDGFEKLVGQLDYPVFIVTTCADGRKAGCLVGFATQASIRPPRFLIGLSHRNRTTSVAELASHLAVHVIPRAHLDVVRLFGGETGDVVDKFDHCDWHRGPAGMPILEVADAWFVGAVVERFDLGDHVGHLLQPVAAHAPGALKPFATFADVHELEPGHEA